MTDVYSGIRYDSGLRTYTISLTAAQADIQTVLDTAADGSTLRFEAGTFNFSSRLTVDRDNLTIQGTNDATGTTVFKFDSSLTIDSFVVTGRVDKLSLQTVPQDLVAGTKTLVLSDTSTLKAGDVLHVFQDNDAAFLSSGIYDRVKNLPDMAINPLRESLVEIESINGNVITLKHEIGYDMTGGAAKVEKIDVLKNISVSDLTLTYDDTGLGTLNPNLFENPLLQFDNHATMSVRYTDNIQLSNLTLIHTPSNGLEIRNSVDAKLDGLVVDGAYNKGGDGNGYALHIAGTSNSTFEHLTLTDVRHAVLFSSWNAEINNFVQVDYTNRDINYHGSPDHSNTVIVNESVYGTDGSRAWALISPGHPDMHPYTDISQNTNLFGHAEGAFKNDILFGWDKGSVLFGNAGDDQLTGGAGNDLLAGGVDNDLLAGGAGVDTYLYRAGDGQDVITDFNAALDGDVLRISGYNALASLGDIKIDQVGGDTLLTFLTSTYQMDTILLKGVDASLLGEHCLFFTPNADAAALNVTLSSGNDWIKTSGNANDMVTTYISSLNGGDSVILGAGVDTVKFITNGFTLDTALMNGFSGVDVLDVTGVTGAKMYLTQSLLDSTDAHKLTVSYGVNGVERLGASGLSADNTVVLKGNGAVFLADNLNNEVTLTSETLGSVTGRGGNDTFHLSGVTNLALDGGSGNDKFIFESGLPTANLTLNGGLGVDELYFTQAVTLNSLALKNVQGIEKMTFAASGSDIQLNDAFVSGGPIEIRAVGAERLTEKLRLGGMTRNAEFVVGDNVNLYLSGTVTTTNTVRIMDGATGYVKGSLGSDILIGGNQKDTLKGEGGNDDITGGLGSDSLYGGDGRDTFRFVRGDAADTIYDFAAGTSGDVVHLTSYYAFNSFADVMSAMTQRDATTVRLSLTPTEYIIFKNCTLDRFVDSNFTFDNSRVLNLTLQATTGVERLITSGGTDVVEVGGVNRLTAGDVVSLGLGTDTLRLTGNVGTIDTRAMTISGVEVVDTTATTSRTALIVSDAFAGGSNKTELLISVGSAGLLLDTSSVIDPHTVVLRGDHTGAVLADGVANIVTLDIANTGFTLTGGTGADTVRVRGGDVTVDGGDGNDRVTVTGNGTYTLRGGNGDDIFLLNDISFIKGERIDGGAGVDEIRLYQAADLTYTDLAFVTGIERLTVGSGTMNLALDTALFDTSLTLKTGSGVADVYIDMSRLDVAHKLIIDSGILAHLSGEAGDSYVIETTSRVNQPIYGSAGNETLIGGTGVDVFNAGLGDDRLSGGYGNDRLSGDAGNDWLAGGRGNDVLSGGAGNDVFVFTDKADAIDTILDFHGTDGDRDQIDLTALFDANGLGTDQFNTALSLGHLILQQSGTDVNVFFDRDGVKIGAAVQIATIQNTHVSDLDQTNVLV